MHNNNEVSNVFNDYNVYIYLKICIIIIYTKFWEQNRFEHLCSGFIYLMVEEPLLKWNE